jgi:hypothetical protein
MEIKTFGVVGAGQMGSGIAQVAAMSGLNVILHDIEEAFLQRGMATIDRFLSKGVERGKLAEEDKVAILGRIKTTTDLKDMARADFVVEAATENEKTSNSDLPNPGQRCPPVPFWQHQYLFHSHRPHRRPDRTSGQRHRHALHEPGAGDETGGGHPGAGHLGRDLQPDLGSFRKFGKCRRRPMISRALSPTGS